MRKIHKQQRGEVEPTVCTGAVRATQQAEKFAGGRHPEKGHLLRDVVAISVAGQRWAPTLAEGLPETQGEEEDQGPDEDEEMVAAGEHGNNQYDDLQGLEEQWELLRQQMIGSPHWQAGRGLEQVNGEWGFDEPNWQMGEESGGEEVS